MKLFLLFVPLSFFLAVLQSIVPDLLFFSGIGFEISLILVIYQGFHFEPLKGGLLSFILGFLVDTMSGAPTGLYMFLYVCLFSMTTLIARAFQADRPIFIAFYTFVCALFEGILIVAFYEFIPEIHIGHLIPTVFMPQAVLLAVSAPFFFKGFRWIEESVHARDT
ncbi:MAG: rod shape-determining protein MreD [Syntrophales bacterium]